MQNLLVHYQHYTGCHSVIVCSYYIWQQNSCGTFYPSMQCMAKVCIVWLKCMSDTVEIPRGNVNLMYIGCILDFCDI